MDSGVKKQPQIGTAIFIVYNNKVLLAKRKSLHEHNKYGVPGGKLDFGENIEQCIERETLEETGLKIKNLVAIPLVTNAVYNKEGAHYVCFWFKAEPDMPYGWNGQIDFIEKDKNGNPKCEEWKWYTEDEVYELDTMRGTKYALNRAFDDRLVVDLEIDTTPD